MDANNPHYERSAWSTKIYWKDGHACGRDDGPTRVELREAHKGYPTLSFEMPRQRHELRNVDLLMQYAYERGKADRSVEVGKLLKDLIAF